MMDFDSNPIPFVKCKLVQGDLHGKKYYYLMFEDNFILDVTQPHDFLGRIKDDSVPFKRVFEADCPIQKYYHEGNTEKRMPILNQENLLTHKIQSNGDVT